MVKIKRSLVRDDMKDHKAHNRVNRISRWELGSALLLSKKK